MTALAPKSRAPAATDRPWLPALAVTKTRSEKSRAPVAPSTVQRRLPRDGIGGAQGLEAAEPHAGPLVLDEMDATPRSRSPAP